MRRELSFKDAKSDKFWHIAVVDTVVETRWGRTGTDGQVKTAWFATPEKALTEAEKQVAAKLKKGYVDDHPEGTGGAAPSAPATPAPTAAAPAVTTGAGAGTAPRATKTTAAALADPGPTVVDFTGATGELRLTLHPWQLAVDPRYDLGPLVAGEPGWHPSQWKKKTKLVLERVTYQRDIHFSAPPFGIPSREESWWWLRLGQSAMSWQALSTVAGGVPEPPASNQDIGRELHTRSSGDPAEHAQKMCGLTGADWDRFQSMAMVMTCRAYDTPLLLALACGIWGADEVLRFLAAQHRADERLVRSDAARGVYAMASPEAQQEFAGALPAELGPTSVVAASFAGRADEAAAWATRAALEAADNGTVLATKVLTLIEDVDVRRRALAIDRGFSRFSLMGDLGALGAEALPALAAFLVDKGADDDRLVRHVAAVAEGVPLVPFMAAVRKVEPKADEWLRTHPAEVAAWDGDVPDHARSVVAASLRSLPAERLEAARATATGVIAECLDGALTELRMPEVEGVPDWWATAVEGQVLPPWTGKRGAPPSWLNSGTLPALAIDGAARLRHDQVEDLLRFMATNLDGPEPALQAAVAARVDEPSRMRFATELFESWMAGGAPSGDKWVMSAATRFGGDRFALHLAPLVRKWPGESQHPRAVAGLGALAALGTDVALQQISGIAAKIKFKAIKEEAGKAMARIAEGRGMTTDELEDRIVSDGDLDDRGLRRFDYGPRAFLAGISPEAKVVVREEGPDGRPTGKARTALPAPNSKDDEDLAEEAKAEFSLMKKALTTLAKHQVARFEQAMVGGRRWRAEEHHTLIATHRLLRSLLNGVVWGIEQEGTLVATARIDEDGGLVDAEDTPVEVPQDATVGIVHPVHLDDDQRAAWSQVLADYELVAPFPQLTRTIYRTPAGQGGETNLVGLDTTTEYPGAKLVGVFSRAGWQRGAVLDAGNYCVHGRYYESGDVTAFITVGDGMWIGMVNEMDDQHLERVSFVPGKIDLGSLGWGTDWDLKQVTLLPWSEVPAEVVSEVLTVVHDITG